MKKEFYCHDCNLDNLKVKQNIPTKLLICFNKYYRQPQEVFYKIFAILNGKRPATLLKRDPNTGVFLSMLLKLKVQ